MKKTIMLFDMDGVLVEPMRYRASLQRTMDFFGRIMGWEELYPGEETIAWFEARGIISEWDIAPLCIASVIEVLLENNPELKVPADLLSFCEMVKTAGIPKPEVQIESIIGQLPSMKKAGYTYCDLVLYLIESGPARLTFDRLAGTSLISNLLQHSRNVHQNIITRVFQEIFLGQVAFENAFHLASICSKYSVQNIIDRPLITPQWNDQLKKRWEIGAIELAILTARPSAEDYPAGDGRIEFSPEADIIVNQLGWNRFLLVGQGQLQFIADQLGCFSVDLIKPSPVHALGAIGTLITKNMVNSFQAAWDLFNGNDTDFFKNFPEMEIHVFEDAPVGIRAASRAADMLDSQGIRVQLTKWGISTDPNKVKELQNLGALIVPDVNEALEMVPALS
ncbi:MAG: hypothetical protein GX577_01040 [Leptolinea sp.]|nr:hypothetical protein [Leptolinea sp.]